MGRNIRQNAIEYCRTYPFFLDANQIGYHRGSYVELELPKIGGSLGYQYTRCVQKETLANLKELPYQNLFNTVIGIHLMIFKIYIFVKSVSIHSL